MDVQSVGCVVCLSVCVCIFDVFGWFDKLMCF